MQLIENEKYYFDPVAAERPVKIIEHHLKHYEDKYADQPFLLMDWQKQITYDLFGWKRKDNGLRRFRELYLETAKGSGKSPFLTALGIYMLVGDNEPSSSVYAVATDFAQARDTIFQPAKNMILASPKLSEKCDCKELLIKAEYSIKGKQTFGTWRILSGTADGRHGFRPTCLIMDEAHEWPNRKLYDNITSNMHKRSQPLLLVATNAGASKQTICWQLHERAQRVIDGKSNDDTLYAVIYAAHKDAKIDDQNAWKDANPSLGTTITIESLKSEATKAKEDSAAEAKFRRFYLGQWIQGSDKWINMAHFDACTRPFKISEVKHLPLYIGLDPAAVDDLYAMALLWVGKKNIYIRVKQFLPKKTAYKYEDRDSIPFTHWASREGGKRVTLLKSETIDRRFHKKLAKLIKSLSEKFDLQPVCYDSAKAFPAINYIERLGIVCTPISQKIQHISPACEELTRRLKDQSIIISPNPCLHWQAENAEVIRDNNGNIRLAKENASDSTRYAGRRGSKIDGISAIVTGLWRAMKHGMGNEQEQSKVGIYFV